MESENNPYRLFFVSEHIPEQANAIAKIFEKLDIYSFSSVYSTLAHIHLQPDFIFILETAKLEVSDLAFLQKIQELAPNCHCVFVKNNPQVIEAVLFIKSGAKDYIAHTFFTIPYITTLLEALSGEKWDSENKTKPDILDKFRALGFWGTGRSMRKLYNLIDDAAKADNTVFIVGETGCEHELVAKTVHKLSKKQHGAFQVFDVLAYPVESLDFELFGREKDTFSGILKRKIGAIETASGGALYIDNIEAMSINLQSRFLRALREKKFIKPGGPNIVFWNARLFISSRTNLYKAVQKGIFREDLYYFTSGFPIQIPALRNRGQDILNSANNFLREFTRLNKLKSLIFTQGAKDSLLQYAYPGNLQELKIIVETSALIANATEIAKEDLIFQQKPMIDHWQIEELTLEKYTEKIIVAFLDKYDNDVAAVAKKLNIGKSTIYRMLQKNKMIL